MQPRHLGCCRDGVGRILHPHLLLAQFGHGSYVDLNHPCQISPNLSTLTVWPSGKTSPRYLRRLAKWQEKHDPAAVAHDFTGREAFATDPAAWKDPKTGNALPVDAPIAPFGGAGGNQYPDAPGYPSGYEQRMMADGGRSGRPSTQYGSEAGLVR